MAYQTLSLADLKNTGVQLDPLFLTIIQELPALTKRGPWIAGGSVRKFVNSQTNEADYDIFFTDLAQKEAWTIELVNRGATMTSETNLNTTYDYQGWKIQCIHWDMQSTLIKTMDRFDMAHCQYGFDGTNFVWSEQASLDVKEKALTFLKADDPVYLLNRAMKFAGEGFKPRHGEIARVLKGVVKDPKSVKAASRGGLSGNPEPVTSVGSALIVNADHFSIVKP